MGFIRSCFTFMLGTASGIYVAQNYNVPNVKKMADMAIAMAKVYEANYRKSRKGGDDNSD